MRAKEALVGSTKSENLKDVNAEKECNTGLALGQCSVPLCFSTSRLYPYINSYLIGGLVFSGWVAPALSSGAGKVSLKGQGISSWRYASDDAKPTTKAPNPH